MIKLSRRHFIRGAGLILAAPAIVQISSLMPVRAIPPPKPTEILRYVYTADGRKEELEGKWITGSVQWRAITTRTEFQTWFMSAA